MATAELIYTSSSSAYSTTGAYTISGLYNTLIKEPTYTDKDKQIFIDELKKQRIYLPSIDHDLNDFNSFIRFMTVSPTITPNKLGVYITKVMKYDDTNTNNYFNYPRTTHGKKFGDCSDGAILCSYVLEKCGYTRPVKDSQLPFVGKLSSGEKITSYSNIPLQFPLLIAYSKDPISKPVEQSFYHALCIYADPETGLLSSIDTSDGLIQSKCKDLRELLDKYEPAWQKIMIFQMNNGAVKSYPYVLIERSAEKPAK